MDDLRTAVKLYGIELKDTISKRGSKNQTHELSEEILRAISSSLSIIHTFTQNNNADSLCKKRSDDLSQIVKMREELEDKHKYLESIIGENEQQLKEVTHFKEAQALLHEKHERMMDKMRLDVIMLEDKCDLLSEQAMRMDDCIRKNTFIIDNVQESSTESCYDTALDLIVTLVPEFIVDHLDTANRLDGSGGRGSPRSIKVTLTHRSAIDVIMRNKRFLKAYPKFEKVFLSEDKNQMLKSQIRDMAQIEELAQVSNLNVTARENVLFYNGCRYQHKDIHKLPIELHLNDKRVRVAADYIVYAGDRCKLSNLYKCEVRVKGESFKSLEHAYQYTKALYVNQPDLAERIRASDSAYLAKSLGDSIQSEDWGKVARKFMSEMMLDKYSRNQDLGQYLKLTGTRCIYEGTLSKIWGGGARPSDNCYETGRIHGKNLAGEILMEVRQILFGTKPSNRQTDPLIPSTLNKPMHNPNRNPVTTTFQHSYKKVNVPSLVDICASPIPLRLDQIRERVRLHQLRSSQELQLTQQSSRILNPPQHNINSRLLQLSDSRLLNHVTEDVPHKPSAASEHKAKPPIGPKPTTPLKSTNSSLLTTPTDQHQSTLSLSGDQKWKSDAMDLHRAAGTRQSILSPLSSQPSNLQRGLNTADPDTLQKLQALELAKRNLLLVAPDADLTSLLHS